MQTVLTPLKAVAGGLQRPLLILVDALDEAVQHKGSETIVDFLANAGTLPRQVRFVLTTRPEGAVLRHFEERQIPHFRLDAGRPENLEDIRRYVRGQLETSEALSIQLADQRTPEEVFVERVITASQGNFLYVVWLLPAIANGSQRFDKLDALPAGLDGIYREFLRVRKIGMDEEIFRARYRKTLGILAASRAPLSQDQIAAFSHLGRQEIRDVLRDIGQFLSPGGSEQDRYQLYHQSVIDFLTDEKRAAEFWIDLVPIHQDIVAYYRQGAPSWEQVNWGQVDDYGLKYLAVHVYSQNKTRAAHLTDVHPNLASELHELLLDSRFGRAVVERFRSPVPYLDNLRLGLELALARIDIVQIWRYVDQYRQVLQDERRHDRFIAEVQTGNFEAALDRTALYGDQRRHPGPWCLTGPRIRLQCSRGSRFGWCVHHP